MMTQMNCPVPIAAVATVAAVTAVTAVTAVGSLADIPNSADALTMEQVSEQWVGFYRENVLETFRKTVNQSAPWFADAEAGIEQMIDWWSLDPVRPNIELQALSDDPGLHAAEAGCDHPVFLYTHAYRLLELGGTHTRKGAETMVAATRALQNDGGLPRNLLAIGLREVAIRTNDRETYGRAILFYWSEVIEDRIYLAAADRLLYRELQRTLERALSVDDAERLAKAINESPAASGWLKAMVMGRYEILRAFEIRTGADVRQVGEDQLESFNEHLKLAFEYLKRAELLEPAHPEAASLIVQVMNGMGPRRPRGETERKWFDRAVRAQIDWRQAYDTYAWAMKPRWGGSAEALRDFAIECFETKRYDTRIPYFGFSALADAIEDTGDFTLLVHDGMLDTLAAAADGMRGHPSYADLDDVMLSVIAFAALVAEDAMRAVEYYRKCGQFTFGELERKLRVPARDVAADIRKLANI